MNGQTLWLMALLFVGISSMMGSINYMTTIIMLRAPGMTMFRLPMTIWAMFITAILQAFALPVLTVGPGHAVARPRRSAPASSRRSPGRSPTSPAAVGGGQTAALAAPLLVLLATRPSTS